MNGNEREKLLELFTTDFVFELAEMFVWGQPERAVSSEEVDKIIADYSIANGKDYDDIQRMFGDELSRRHYFD